jgi:hypothetical protein
MKIMSYLNKEREKFTLYKKNKIKVRLMLFKIKNYLLMFSNQIETNYWNKWKNWDLDSMVTYLKNRKFQDLLNLKIAINSKNFQVDL